MPATVVTVCKGEQSVRTTAGVEQATKIAVPYLALAVNCLQEYTIVVECIALTLHNRGPKRDSWTD
jgi:hypothetical protein